MAGRLQRVGLLEEHARLHAVNVGRHGQVLTSAAVRGHPSAAPGLLELLDALPRPSGRVADATGSAGGGALAVGARLDAVRGGGGPTRDPDLVVAETSFAGLRAATELVGETAARAALVWELEPAGFDHVLLLPRTERGTAHVRAELAGAGRALRLEGAAYACMHKDRGARRYEREAAEVFEGVEVVARSRGWRTCRLTRPRAGLRPPGWTAFEALGRRWESLPGVFAAGRLDAGTALLLDVVAAVDDASAPCAAPRPSAARRPVGPQGLAGARVLDLGCGCGVLGGAALLAGAGRVTLLDDDLAAVRSARRNLGGAAGVRVALSDVDAALPPDERFDVVVANPPFHLGTRMRPSTGRAFLAAARRRLSPGGWLLAVANRALPYEDDLGVWARWEVVREDATYKVLRAWR